MKEHNVLSIVLRDNLHQPQVNTDVYTTHDLYYHMFIYTLYLVCGETREDIEILY